MTSTSQQQIKFNHNEQAVLQSIGKRKLSELKDIAEDAGLRLQKVYDMIRDRLKPKGFVDWRLGENEKRVYFLTARGKEYLGIETSEADGSISEVLPFIESASRYTLDVQRNLVLKAIDDKYRTYGGIKKEVGFLPDEDIEELLASMCVASDKNAPLLRTEEKGDLFAYFRWETKPTNFWRIGDGRVEATFEENFVPRDEKAKAEELAKFSITPSDEPAETPLTIKVTVPDHYANEVEKDAAASIDETENTTESSDSHNSRKRTGRRTVVPYTKEFFYKEGRAGKSQAEIARDLGVHHTTIWNQLQKEEFRAAWEAGIREFRAAKSTSKEEASDEISEDDMAEEKGTIPPEFEPETAFDETKQALHESIVELAEVEFFMNESGDPVDLSKIPLSSGSLIYGFSGSYFKLTKRERDMLEAIAEVVEMAGGSA
jgi:DNA-binding MarR family transcriptional regulator